MCHREGTLCAIQGGYSMCHREGTLCAIGWVLYHREPLRVPNEGAKR